LLLGVMNHEVRMGEQNHAACAFRVPATSSRAGDELVQDGAEHCHLTLFGIATLIIADDPRLLATARAALVDWLSEAPMPEPEIILRLARDDRPADWVSPAIRVGGSRLTIDGEGICGEADATTGKARCRVPAWLIDAPDALTDQVIDPLLLFLATRRGRTPVHASGVMIGDTAVVLAGASGSGKSTLAVAAMTRGLTVLSDDTLYVEHSAGLRVWGIPRPIHVFPSDAPAGQHETRLRGGKVKHAVHLPAGPRYADRAALIILARGHRLALDAIAPDEAMRVLAKLEPGFDLLREESAAAVAALSAHGAWRLRLTHDPDAAIALLQEAFG
jgi:hypothetical protein